MTFSLHQLDECDSFVYTQYMLEQSLFDQNCVHEHKKKQKNTSW